MNNYRIACVLITSLIGFSQTLTAQQSTNGPLPQAKEVIGQLLPQIQRLKCEGGTVSVSLDYLVYNAKSATVDFSGTNPVITVTATYDAAGYGYPKDKRWQMFKITVDQQTQNVISMMVLEQGHERVNHGTPTHPDFRTDLVTKYLYECAY